jgi:hypothetical protein
VSVEWSEGPGQQSGPLTTEEVLIEEAYAIGTSGGRPFPTRLEQTDVMPDGIESDIGVGGDDADAQHCRDTAREQQVLYRALNDLDRAALCLSGGGIRSAAFSLGVIQALATHPRPRPPQGMFAAETAPDGSAAARIPQTGINSAPYNVVAKPEESLLAQVQYLSTVSGGGYIGSWLSAWRSRAGFDTVWANLVGRPCGPDIEPHTIAWLRAYSNYLTPKLGALSGDTWAGIAITLRNLLLNWLVIIPAICLVILLLKLFTTISVGLVMLPPSGLTAALSLILAAILLVTALRFSTANRPSLRGEDLRDKLGLPLGATQGAFIRWSLVPATLAAGALIQFGASNSGLALDDGHSAGRIIAVTALATSLVYAIAWLFGDPERLDRRDFWVWTASGLIYGALIGTGAYLYNQAPYDTDSIFNDLLTPVMFGVPWVLMSQMIAEMIFVGLSSYQRMSEVGAHDDSDSDREWLGRAGGWYLVISLSWFIVTFLIFAVPLVHQLSILLAPDHWKEISGIVATLSGAVSWIITKTTPLSVGVGKGARGAKPLPANTVLSILLPIFLAILTVYLSGGLDQILLGDSFILLLRYPGVQIVPPNWLESLGLLMLGLVVAGILLWIIRKLLRRLFRTPRWWLFIVAAPVFATTIVIVLPVVIDFVGRLTGIGLLRDPWRLASTEAWETTVPLGLGLVITGLAAYVVARHVSERRFARFAMWFPIWALIAIVFVAAALEVLASFGAIRLDEPGLGIFSPGWFTIFAPLLVGFVVMGAVTWLASCCININRFSLHAVYRNRLVRAFLGSSRPKRNPDAFSDFDEDDNPAMTSLWPRGDSEGSWPNPKHWRPFHVINMALNIVSTRHLSWQERKAESFTVSPLHSGSACKAFRRSDEYGGRKGLSLGTAMAISGAAASPNMGYHSSPAISFLLALFNLRLGWWLGNPGWEGQETYRYPGPGFALAPLVEEAFGLTTDERPYVYLSDGGHFENLGLYEMIRRRCRYIVAVDAGADPDYTFEDLGNAVRKIAIDLGIKIRFDGLDKLKKRDGDNPRAGVGIPYHAIGEIDYPAADGGGKDNFGIILYIKPGYHGVENADIRAYALANPEFPHQGTIDQFFSESQFESYRALGFEITDGLLSDVLERLPDRNTADLKAIFAQLRKDTLKSRDGWSAPVC